MKHEINVDKHYNVNIKLETTESSEEDIENFLLDLVVREGIEILSEPVIKKTNDDTYEIHFVTRPKVEAPNVDDLINNIKFDDFDLQTALNESLSIIRYNLSPRAKADKSLTNEDIVVLDIKITTKEGDVLSDQTNETIVMASSVLIEPIKKELIGLKTGDEKKFIYKFDKNYFQKQYAGKECEFEVKIIQIYSVELVDLDDNLAKLVLGEGSSLKDLEEQLKADLEKSNIAKRQQRLLERIIADSKVDYVPEELIVHEMSYLIEKFGLEKENKTKIYNEAERNVILRLALDEIFSRPNWNVSDEQVIEAYKGPEKDNFVKQYNELNENDKKAVTRTVKYQMLLAKV